MRAEHSGGQLVPIRSKPRETGPRWAKGIALVAAAGIGIHLALRFLSADLRVFANIPLYVTLLAGGVPLIVQLGEKLWTADFGSDFLAGVSIVTVVVLREYLVASIVVLMLSGGTALEVFATRRASRVLDTLAKRMPSAAHRKTDRGPMDISIGEIQVGDVLIVFPHEICPVDGVVIEGHGSMNEAYLTGEPCEVGKVPGAGTFSGALNGGSVCWLRLACFPRLPARSHKK